MNDTFLPGSGFDTYETQDRVLVAMDGTTEAAVAVRILQQQGFGVAGAVVRLDPAKTRQAEAAKAAAEALGIECILLNAEALAQQPEAAGDPGFAALLTAADKLGIQYIAAPRYARVETGAEGRNTVHPPVDTAREMSKIAGPLTPYSVNSTSPRFSATTSLPRRMVMPHSALMPFSALG